MIKIALSLAALLAVAPSTTTSCYGSGGPCFAVTNSPGGIGLQGVSSGGNSGTGVSAQRNGPGGNALQANNPSGTGIASLGNPSFVAESPANGRALLYEGLGANGPVFRVNARGDAYFSGKVVGSHESLQATASGQTLTTYASQSTTPALEDFGETTLVRGLATVRFDARFAASMQRATYLVFVTAQGPSGALYVAQKTPYGFAVSEAAPGHSTVPIDYRVVVQPFGVAPVRLPVATDR